MINAGANYVDEPLMVDLITSRQPGDLRIFTTAILNRLGMVVKKQLCQMKRLECGMVVADAWGAQPKVKLFRS